jgi:hypothetical protein
MPDYFLNESAATLRYVFFTAVKTDDVNDRLTAAEMSGGTWTAKLTKLGATPATPAGGATPSEVSSALMPGVWYLPLAAADLDTLGKHVLMIQNAGGTKVMRPREIEINVIARSDYVANVPANLTQLLGSTIATPTTAGYLRADVHAMENGVLTAAAIASDAFTAAKFQDSALTLAKFAADTKLSLFGQIDSGVAQGGSLSTIQLRSGASSVVGAYVDAVVIAISGTGALQINTIDSYDATTKIATMKRAWGTAPNATTNYVVLSGSASGTAPSASVVASAVWAAISENATSYGDQWRGIFAVLGGKVEDFRTGTLAFKSMDGATVRATGTVAARGRIAVTWNTLSP